MSRMVVRGVVCGLLAFAGMTTAAFASPLPPSTVAAVTDTSSSCPNALSGVNNVAVASFGGKTYAFGVGYWSGQLVAVDITTPAAPAIVGCTPPIVPPATSPLIGATNITISGNYAYVTAKNRNASSSSNDDGNGNALTVVDIHNPASPSVVGSLQDPNHLFGAYAVNVASIGGGTYAVVASQGLLAPPQPQTPDTSQGSLSIIDVSSPSSPVIAGAGAATIDNSALMHNELQHPTGVAIYTFPTPACGGTTCTYAYVVAYGSHRLSVFNISNPTIAPALVGSTPNAGDLSNPNDVFIQGHYAYVVNQSATNAQLSVWDLSTPTNPTFTGGSLNNPALNGAYRIRILNNIAYIASSNSAAIAMVDVSDPTNPVFLGSDTDATNLSHADSVALDSAGSAVYAIGTSPLLNGQSNPLYPPYPLQIGGPPSTGTISVVQVDPAPSFTAGVFSGPTNPTTLNSASLSFGASDQVALLTCALDGGSAVPCDPGTASYNNLALGSHTFTVHATDAAGNTATSPAYTWSVQAVQNVAPKSTSAPQISGSAMQGATLTLKTGSWNGTPAPTLAIKWERCDSSGNNCNVIAGQTGATYQLGVADVGSRLKGIVTASNVAGSASASALTAVVGWSSVSGITATLRHAKSSKPSFGLNVPALGGGIVVQKLSVSLPKGISFASLKQLEKALSLQFPAHKAIKFKATISHGVLTLTLTRPAPGAVLSLGSGALKLSRGEAKQLKSKHAKALKVTVTVFYTGLPSRQATVSVRLA